MPMVPLVIGCIGYQLELRLWDPDISTLLFSHIHLKSLPIQELLLKVRKVKLPQDGKEKKVN
jgi:hypothetical protein